MGGKGRRVGGKGRRVGVKGRRVGGKGRALMCKPYLEWFADSIPYCLLMLNLSPEGEEDRDSHNNS